MMNYQYYRILVTPNYNSLWYANNYFSTLNYVKIHMSGYQFAATKPTLVFEFLNRFNLGCRDSNDNDTEEFSMIKEFLIGKAEALYNSVVLSNRTSSVVALYCAYINWSLHRLSI